MRVLLIVLALMLACGATALAADEDAAGNDSTMSDSSASTSANASMSAANSSGQAMVDACLTRCLNVSSAQIASLRAKGMTDADIAIAGAIAAKAGQSVSDVAAKFQSTGDWKAVASAYNLSMSDLVSAPVAAGADADAFNTAFFAQYYSVAQSQIAQLRRQGYSWDDINVLANASLRTNQSITQIAALRSQGTTWADIASRYNVAYDTLTTPVKMRCVMVTAPATTGAGPMSPAPCPEPCPPPCPPPCPSVCGAGPSTSCGNGPCIVCDGEGNVILNNDQAAQLYAGGNDWLDVAIATNIMRYTGYPIRQILSDLKSLGTWQQTLVYYGVTENYAYNVADYPFPRKSIYSVGEDAKHNEAIAKYQKPGTWPTCPRGNAPCPGGMGAGVTVVPVPCPNPCGTGPVCPNPPVPVPCPPAK